MSTQKAVPSPVTKHSNGERSVKELWDEAAKEFENICGVSLQTGNIRSFEDLQRKVENTNNTSSRLEDGEKAKRDKAKSVGLTSLKCLKLLVGFASQASSVIPFPAAATSIASNALGFVFDIPKAISQYNDAINSVFGEVASALVQFQIYESIDTVDALLLRQVHLVMVSFVKLCAHVVKYRQGDRWYRAKQKLKSVFDDDSGLSSEMAEFKRALQSQRDVEGTITLAVVMETNQEMAKILEGFIVFGKTAEETHQAVKYLKEDAERSNTLNDIRETLGVWPTVRLGGRTTQTRIDIAAKCLDGTGTWIWSHQAYTSWTATQALDGSSNPHVLILSGPASSGKTSATALIVKRLEDERQRTYVAHYFFPSNTKKPDDDKSPVQQALKYMAFQIARVDETVRKALSKACEAGNPLRSTFSNLDDLWAELKIGTPGSGATYYLAFDGLENLPDKQIDMLLKFTFSPKRTDKSAGRVRILLSGRDDKFPNSDDVDGALRIRMQQHNEGDLRITIDDKLNTQGLLQHTKSDSVHQKVREKIVELLPKKADGSFYQLQLGLDQVVRQLSTLESIDELDMLLGQSVNSHEEAIKTLQLSLTSKEINNLNNLLNWVVFGYVYLTLNQLEAVMYLYSGAESLVSLQDTIGRKYNAILKLEDGYVSEQDGVMQYFQEKEEASLNSKHPNEQSTISMTITIKNVDQEVCGHFFWDLAHKAIREKLKFDFDATSNTLQNPHNVITLDKFKAHHSIVMISFEYLSQERKEQTNDIEQYITAFFPVHLGYLRELEDKEQGSLMPDEKHKIGQKLYDLFKDDELYVRHREAFQQTYWEANEMSDVQKWLTDWSVMRKVDRVWLNAVQKARSPPRGYLKPFATMVVEGLLRARSWPVQNAYLWIAEFIKSDEEPEQPPKADTGEVSPSISSAADEDVKVDWDKVSSWCQSFLQLPDAYLDSLWYERLASAAFTQNTQDEVVLSLYERALEKPNPSWECYHSFSDALCRQGRASKAIAQMELAIQEAKKDNKTELNDIMELKIKLADNLYMAKEYDSAAEYYIQGFSSENEEQRNRSRLGHLKAGLSFSNGEETRKILRAETSSEAADKQQCLASILKMIARDDEFDYLLSKLLTVAKADPALLGNIVRAMETATTTSTPQDSTVHEIETYIAERSAEDAACGVLLYYRGLAAYNYKISTEGTEPVSEALQLWKQCRTQLARVEGPNAFTVKSSAITELAKHYFQIMKDREHTDEDKYDHVCTLRELSDADDNELWANDPDGFLGSLYAWHGDKEQAKAVLTRHVKFGLAILSDTDPDNDSFGFTAIYNALAKYGDFENTFTALAMLGQPDLVTQALQFTAEDIDTDQEDAEKIKVLDEVTELAKETIRIAKAQVPESSQQLRRIQTAKTHVDSLLASVTNTTDPAGTSPIHEHLDMSYRLLHTRVVTLEQTNKLESNPNFYKRLWYMSCDGRKPDGKHCENALDFETDMYYCIYCSNLGFCAECLGRLRGITTPEGAPMSSSTSLGGLTMEITACSAKHRWLKIPASGADMYVGQSAKSVRLPSQISHMGADQSILEAIYSDVNVKEMTVEDWKKELAEEWGV